MSEIRTQSLVFRQVRISDIYFFLQEEDEEMEEDDIASCPQKTIDEKGENTEEKCETKPTYMFTSHPSSHSKQMRVLKAV